MLEEKLTIVSLFSGAGGLDIAACSSGRVGTLLSTDSNPVFLQTVVDNLPCHFPDVTHRHIVADARDLSGDTIIKKLGSPRVDIVIGGPPCDDFTPYGRKKGATGDKAPLIFEFVRMVGELKPRAFLFENVPNLTRQFKDYWQKLLEAFPDEYQPVSWAVLAAKNFGAPTVRERVFSVGFRKSSDREAFEFPSPTHGEAKGQLPLPGLKNTLIPYVTVGKVLADVPELTDQNATLFHNHEGRKHRPQTIEHLKTVPQGVHTRKSFRYRAPWDGLCHSLTAGLDNGTKSYIHPTYHREMSVREYARIHGFPDTWVFSGNHHNGIKQVANSVPIPLGLAVFDSVISAIKDPGIF